MGGGDTVVDQQKSVFRRSGSRDRSMWFLAKNSLRTVITSLLWGESLRAISFWIHPVLRGLRRIVLPDVRILAASFRRRYSAILREHGGANGPRHPFPACGGGPFPQPLSDPVVIVLTNPHHSRSQSPPLALDPHPALVRLEIWPILDPAPALMIVF